MKKHIFYFTLLALIFVSCKQTGNHQSSTNEKFTLIQAYTLPFEQEKKLNLSAFVEDIDIIPLELTEASLLSTDIDKIKIHKKNILVLERRQQRCIYRFDLKGNFLNKIGEKGQGPHEFIELSDFSIDEENDIVFLLDNARKSILCYQMNGEFIKSIRIDMSCMRMEYQDGLFYIFEDQPYRENSYSLEIKNMEGKTITKFFPSKRYMNNYSTPTFNKQDDYILFYRSKNDTVYKFHKDTLSYAYFIDFDSYRLTPEEIEDIYQGRVPTINILQNKERVSGINFVYQLNDLLFFQTTYKLLTYFYIYNIKKDELSISGGVSGLYDDLYYTFFSNSFHGCTKDALIGFYDANGIKRSIKSLDNFEKHGHITAEKKQQVKDKMLSYCDIRDKEERNPWVLIYHLKKK